MRFASCAFTRYSALSISNRHDGHPSDGRARLLIHINGHFISSVFVNAHYIES